MRIENLTAREKEADFQLRRVLQWVTAQDSSWATSPLVTEALGWLARRQGKESWVDAEIETEA